MRDGYAICHISNVDWNPCVLDCDLNDNEIWFDAISDIPSAPPHTMFDELGDTAGIWLSKSTFMIPSVIGLMSMMLLVTAPWSKLTGSTPLTCFFIATCF